MNTINHSNTHLDTLNPAQRQAVEAPEGHCLVLAGAGSGKTRVLVHRIALLVQEYNVHPSELLAVTFTNKASNEMRHRIEHLVAMPLSHLWVGTFHGISHRLLRMHWQEADLQEAFQIIDADDQLRLVRRLQKTIGLDEKKWPYKQTQWFINRQKQQGIRAQASIDQSDGYFDERLSEVYLAYERACEQAGVIDFTELLLRAVELLEKNTDIREHYQKRFKHILVDEFQDTNSLQLRWLKLLLGEDHYLMAVGDDDQSIYSWRGANSHHIQQFCDDFKGAQLIRLEQNYRSTKTILRAANTVIANNTSRLGKELWTESDEGEPIKVYAAFSDRDETLYVVGDIERALASGARASDIAILYRSNAQSRLFEERLIQAGIAYRIYGGLRFFERAEVKDALAYLRLLLNPNDDASLERVINLPTRGIGQTTLTVLRELQREHNLSLWGALQYILNTKESLSARAISALGAFSNLIHDITQATQDMSLSEMVAHTIECSGLKAHYKKDRTEKGLSRLENLDELITATDQYAHKDDLLSPLAAFLAQVALDSGDEQASEHDDYVHLMTLHASKGLEFPTVYLVGLEEGLFPHQMSSNEPHGLEEERRLCYVGMTRAKKKLTISHAEMRRLHGSERYNQPSRFMKELPQDALEYVRTRNAQGIQRTHVSSSRYGGTQISNTSLSLGQRVTHPTFGSGIIINTEGHGDAVRVEVEFDRVGKKWLVLSYANLTPC